MKDLFQVQLARAEEEADARLDRILSQGDRPLIRRVSLDLRNREVSSPAEVDVLLAELRALLMAHLGEGARVRLQ